MNIKEVEGITGIQKRNIRFYEQKGLISPKRNSVYAIRPFLHLLP